MHITFVKKILADGTPCKKCREVSDRMDAEGILPHINHIVIADERDVQSEGMRLAHKHQVQRAPFFLVEEAGEITVFDVYFKFKKHLADRGVQLASPTSL